MICDLVLEGSNPKMLTQHYGLWWCASMRSWLQKVQKFRRYLEESHFCMIWALTVTLTRKIGNQPVHMTLWVMMHRHTKFYYERFSGSKDIVRANIPWWSEPSLWPWPWGQQSKWSHNTPDHNDAPQYQIWMQKVQKFRRYGRKVGFSKGFEPTVNLTLNIGTQPFCITLWVMMMHHHTKFGCIQFSVSGDIFRCDRQTHRQTDSNITPPLPPTLLWGV